MIPNVLVEYSVLTAEIIDFNFPTKEELHRIGGKGRLNLFRRYFSADVTIIC
ncbi:MAG: hypothetical protein WA667_21620 [Candidatus Nitrosopolaris sp.]